MSTSNTPPNPAPRRRYPTLRAAWCRCAIWPTDPLFMQDFVCPCGVDKHHYHCPKCLAICQVG